MPICLKCSSNFPNRTKIDGKVRVLNKRKYCLDCSPFGIKNTQQIHLSPKEEDCSCQICGGAYKYKVHRNGGHKVCQRCWRKEKRHALKKQMIEYKGGKCTGCGYNYCHAALDFHHLDPNTKSFEIAGNHNLAWERIKVEIDKCILVCRNCHAEIHAGIRNLRP
jgi:hypothetical protein